MARAGSGRKGRGKTSSGSSTNQNVMPDVYREMLADAVSSSPTKFDEEEKPIKRRRVAGRMVESSNNETAHYQSDQASTNAIDTDIERPTLKSQAARQQTAYAESDDSVDSDVDWEEVDLKDALKEDLSEEDIVQDQELNLVLGGESRETRRPPAIRRKPVSAADKKLRLEIHKMHLLSLLVHVHRRNHWCNDEKVHKVLRRLLDKRAISYLNPDSQKSQFQRSRSFADGLEQAVEIWRERFRIATRGMSRSHWADDPESLANASLPEDLELPIQKSDFLEIAGILEASRDVGAQLFCALLRSVGVDARLVCSLQPLPFTTAARGTTPQKSMPMKIVADPESRNVTSGDESGADALNDASLSIPRMVGSVGGRNRFASANSSSVSGLSKPKPKPKRIRESPYPIYWVEALDEAYQKWIAVDPLVTKSVSKPSRLEPPANDPENQLNYVVAFEDDGSARDVTRRYSKAYNAKTRRERVEVTKGGEKWWRRVMRIYRRDHSLDRDQIEDAQLAQREAQEGMPKNVQDFKDHPYYALERHMRRSEVIHPKREVGKVTAGKSSGDKALEPIYRRRDVHEVKSADKWYRIGREIKTGEQPLKRVTARRSQKSVFDDDQMSEDEDTTGTGLYAVFQTTPYNGPPVVNGRIPKNVYGNLDIYVPSMVPAGGVHIPHPETTRAAKILSIDYADAVTGFAFKGRHGTAIINGAVVATQYREAVEEVINAFECERTEAEEARRSAEALRMWRRLLAGLRIRERIEGYEVEGERNAPRERTEKIDEDEFDDEGAGGFLPDRDAEVVAKPTASRMFVRGLASPEEGGGGFMADEEDLGGGFIDDKDNQDRGIMAGNEDGGGGFIPEDGFGNPNHTTRTEQPTTVRQTHDREKENLGGLDTSDIDEDAEDAMHETEPADPHESHNLVIPIAEEGKKFMPNDSRGGSFLPNDNNEATPPTTRQPSQISPPPVLQLPPEANEPPPPAANPLGLAHEDLAEARMLQTLYESSQVTLRRADTSSEHPAAQHDTPEITSRPPVQAQAQIDAAESESQSPASDPGSLLSHDPEDEDAEPEWLA